MNQLSQSNYTLQSELNYPTLQLLKVIKKKTQVIMDHSLEFFVGDKTRSGEIKSITTFQ